jgi:NodT family efflux transporter outer membrane factor (OMF) lipoprotein
MTPKASSCRSQCAKALPMSAAMFVLLSACAVGPNYRGAPPVASEHYDRSAEQRLAAQGGASDAQHIALAQKIEGGWWSTFQSNKLETVMQKAVNGNLDLVAADATISQANEAVASARGGLRPQLDFGADGGRQRTGGMTSNFYAVGPSVSFDFDVFGGTRRLIEERAALAELERHRYDAAYLALTGNVATQALLLAAARAQIDAVQTLLADDRKNLDLFQTGHQFGSATQVDIALARTQLAQDETLLPPLAQQRDSARHALSILASEGPADWVTPDFDLADFALPPELPVSLPSEMAHERPDILEAEAELHAASAEIGVATADLYPHLQLSASLGQGGLGVGTFWSIASGLAGPLFHGGSLKANQRGSVDGYRSSLAGYQQTVIRSLGQIADVLQAVNHDAEEYSAQKRALTAAETSLQLNRAGYREGEIDVLQVVDAERAYQRALLGEIQARTARYLDTVQLSLALGGNSVGAFMRQTTFDGASQAPPRRTATGD